MLMADFDGDRRSEILLRDRGTPYSHYRFTPGAAGTPGTLTVVRTTYQGPTSQPRDFNGDGADDFFTYNGVTSELYLGCPAGSTLACNGGVTVASQWSVPHYVTSALPDQNHDGLPEVFLGDEGLGLGRLWLHFSDAATGSITPAPVWQALGDPLVYDFCYSILRPGDLNGDRREDEFLILGRGRIYAFFPEDGISPRCTRPGPGRAAMAASRSSWAATRGSWGRRG
jgi:hypothetical protein